MTGEITQYFGDLMLRYDEAGAIRALIQLVPLGIGSAGDTLIASRVKKIREERAREFFDELDKKGAVLTEAVVASEDFIHCFLITSKAALNTRRREKIRLFARLLASSVGEAHPRDTDDYEDMVQTLDEITYTEWEALLILDKYSQLSKAPALNALQWSTTFWKDFESEVKTRLNIPTSEFTFFMNRISRTGLYDQLVGGYLSYAGGVGVLTPKFFRVKNFIVASA
jgi:hypothetical protein